MAFKRDSTAIKISGIDDLYGDLNVDLSNAIAKKTQSTMKRKVECIDNNHYYSHNDDGEISAKKENGKLKEHIKAIEEENLRLKRNIGTLFRTAKNEIHRKDDQIQRLQQQQ